MFENTIALVTGASRGIGQAIALELAKAGATIIGTATTQVGADKISDALKAVSNQGLGIELNVTSNASIQNALSLIHDEFGVPGILVNNAGITRDNLLMRMSEDEWDAVMETNLKAIYRLSKACLRGMMKARFGRIINVGSVVGLTGNPGQCNYAATKAGMLGFSKSLAQEVASRGITVNVVAPGFIATDMTDAMSEAQRESMLAHIPQQRLGQPDDIAKAVLFLASPDANYITGQTLNVNGGMCML